MRPRTSRGEDGVMILSPGTCISIAWGLWRVLRRAAAPDAVVDVDDHRHPGLAAGHVVDVGGLVHDLAERLEDEARGGHVHDRPQAR